MMEGPTSPTALMHGATTDGWSPAKKTARYQHLPEALALAVIVVAATIIRLFWAVWLPVPPQSDYAVLTWMAREIAQGRWPADSYGWVFHGVGYPLALAPAALLTDGVLVLRLTNVLCQVGMVVAVWWLARMLFGRPAALLAATCAALLPGMWSFTPVIAKENLAVLLLPLLAISMLRLDSPARLAASGAIAAALAMVRPNFLSFVPVVGLVVVIAAIRCRSPSIAGWFVLGLTAVLGPIVALNLANGGSPLPTGAAVWQMWEVNNERATGRYFAPDRTDDNPFEGIEDSDEVRQAQLKLGVQFIAANPVASLKNSWLRHRLQWGTDASGIGWSYGRAEQYLQRRVPLDWHELRLVTEGAYLAVLVLAVVGSVRGGREPGVGLALLSPLAWGVTTLALAEGNARYHVAFEPLLCVLAGTACVAPSRHATSRATAPPRAVGIPPRTQKRASGVRVIKRVDPGTVFVVFVCLGILLEDLGRRIATRTFGVFAFWHWSEADVASWLPVLVVVMLSARVLVGYHPVVTRRLVVAAQRRPALTRAAVSVTLVTMISGVAVLMSAANQALDQLAAVAPQGWQRYEEGPTGTRSPLPLVLIEAPMPANLRQVSYPDAVQLNFEDRPDPGTVVGLVRSLADLQVGRRYRFYLQVYDPGVVGDPGERLAISLNDRVVWTRDPGTTRKSGWRYATLGWIADRQEVTIRVERTAGQAPLMSTAAPPMVRTLHLYPTY